MDETFKLVRVFLASPGGLEDERRLAKDAVNEINDTLSEHMGIRVELKGWEDTLPGRGRPQSIINQELDRCEVFIGIMWKRWGTPPSSTGPYTSGFEEEFRRSLSRMEESGKPEMAMYFKRIPADLLEDPGEEVKKVINFRNELINKKFIFFKEFDEGIAFQQHVRKKITQYILSLKQNEAELESQEKFGSPNQSTELISSKHEELLKSPFSKEGHQFLTKLLERTEGNNSNEEITLFDVARLRLLSSTISKAGNDKPYVGAHDANIIFLNRENDFGLNELSRLVDCGLENIRSENVPLWFWYFRYKSKINNNFLSFRSLSPKNEDLMVGTLHVMTLIGEEIPDGKEDIGRNIVIGFWLSIDVSNNVKTAALNYLKNYGVLADLPQIEQEFENSNPSTVRAALEAILKIQLRYCKKDALTSVLTKSFESVDQQLLQETLQLNLEIDQALLEDALSHRNEIVRLYALDRLINFGALSSQHISELEKDPSPKIRSRIVNYLISSGRELSEAEVKEILILKDQTNQPKGLLNIASSTNSDGSDEFENYRLSKYKSMSKKGLLNLIDEELYSPELPYLALYESYFTSFANELRNKIRDNFEQHLSDIYQRMTDKGVPANIVDDFRKFHDFVKKTLTRKGVDILCRQKKPEDLELIRSVSRDGFIKSSIDEIDYFHKYGEWEDIPFLVMAEQDFMARKTILGSHHSSRWSDLVASAIYKIGNTRLDEVLELEKLDGEILCAVLSKISQSKFSNLKQSTLTKLFNNKSEKVRKTACIKFIRSNTKTKIKSALDSYTKSDQFRYYNVIHWLDFGVSSNKNVLANAINYLDM